MEDPAPVAARRALLALSVLDDVDLLPADDGWELQTPVGLSLRLSHREVAAAVAGHDPDGPEAVASLRAWVSMRLDLLTDDLVTVVGRARPVALPVGHALHPGAGWVMTPVLGGALDLGLGIRGTPDDSEAVVILPPQMLCAVGAHAGAMADRALRYLDDMAALAADRLRRDPVAPLRPLGDCDVVTLLASEHFRLALVAVDPSGMRTAAVPMRTRGWLDLGRIDPAFALAAAAATDPHERGFERPVLITRDEVVMAREGGNPVSFALLDAVSTERHRSPIARSG